MLHLAFGQSVIDEYGLDGLEIILGREVHHREVLIIELAMLGSAVAISLNEVVEHVPMRVAVPVEVHADEPYQLKVAGVDGTAMARMAPRHGLDAVLLEPFNGVLLRELIDRCR